MSVRYRRISKAEAVKLFLKGDHPIFLCPCKFRPEGPFSMAAMIAGREYLEKAKGYEKHKDSPVWKGTVEKTAWELMYDNWKFYNATYETGYYAHYYVQEEVGG